MNKLLPLALAALVGIAAAPASATVEVSISLGQPGFYGQLDLSDAPHPRILYGYPRRVERGPSRQEPVYMHVRPGHARHWSRYCHQYDACGERVYFVTDNWYNEVYVPHYRNRGNHHRGRDHHRGHDHDDNRVGSRDRNRRDYESERRDYDNDRRDREDERRRDAQRREEDRRYDEGRN